MCLTMALTGACFLKKYHNKVNIFTKRMVFQMCQKEALMFYPEIG
jgi:hypothetical protein